MDVFFLGNCQVNALRGICRDMFPRMKAQAATITPYWGKYDEAAIEQALDTAPLIVSQAIENRATRFNVDELRARAPGRVVFVPYIYVDGIAGLEIIGSKGRTVVKGAAEALAGQEGRKAAHVFDDLCRGRIDLRNAHRVQASLARLAEKEATCDIRISDYLAETWRRRPMLYGINHPTQHIVFEQFRRLCTHVGWAYDPATAADPVIWGKRALPSAQRAFMPSDVAALGLDYPADPHWYGQAYKLLMIALKPSAQEKREIAAD